MAETRWEQARAQERAAGQGGYGAHFARLMDEGVDIEGEARLADVLAPRGGWILDAGSGMGRVGASLLARGHHVVGVDFDAEIIEQSRSTFPDLPVVPSRLDELTPELLECGGLPDGVRRGRLRRQRDDPARARHRAHGPGRCCAHCSRRTGASWSGSASGDAPAPTSREYPVAEFVADCEAVGLRSRLVSRRTTCSPSPTTATTSCTCSGRPASTVSDH